MKLWRKLAKKENAGTDFEKRNGREIKHQIMMSEQMGKSQKKSYPLLEALFKKAEIRYALTKKQQEALIQLAAEEAAKDEVLVPELVENTNETK